MARAFETRRRWLGFGFRLATIDAAWSSISTSPASRGAAPSWEVGGTRHRWGMLATMRLRICYLVLLSLPGLEACSERPLAESPATESIEQAPEEDPSQPRFLGSPGEPDENSRRDSMLALEGELVAAEQQLSAALPGAPHPSAIAGESEDAQVSEAANGDDEAPATGSPARVRAPQSREASAQPDKAARAKRERGESNCDLACKAWASMRRATDRICEIDGPEGNRCGGARLRVSSAKSRLDDATCACPVDGEP